MFDVVFFLGGGKVNRFRIIGGCILIPSISTDLLGLWGAGFDLSWYSCNPFLHCGQRTLGRPVRWVWRFGRASLGGRGRRRASISHEWAAGLMVRQSNGVDQTGAMNFGLFVSLIVPSIICASTRLDIASWLTYGKQTQRHAPQMRPFYSQDVGGGY